MIAITTGQFVWYNAALTFVWMVIGGICAGVAVGFIFMKVHKYLPTDANMDILLTLVTPYVMYIVAEEVNASGVLAVVSGGLFLSQYQHRFLSTSARLRGINVWQAIVFALNGIVFMLIGLDLPEITSGLGDVSLSAAIGYGLLVTAVLVVGRILSAYGAVFVTLIMRNFITVADPNPGFKGPFLLGWTGMRGVVSLAAALSIPADFPQRNLILFITFIVILTTLLLQGLTLPYFIRKIEFPKYDDYLPEEEADTELKRGMAREALQFMNENYGEEIDKHPVLQQLAMKWESNSEENIDPMMSPESKVIYLDVINKQRKWLMNKNSNAHHFDEDVIRKYLYLLDIEEEKLKFM
jgi:CPA1 family monovalent cation:H+ antiporter